MAQVERYLERNQELNLSVLALKSWEHIYYCQRKSEPDTKVVKTDSFFFQKLLQ